MDASRVQDAIACHEVKLIDEYTEIFFLSVPNFRDAKQFSSQ